jgi:hypothetical protein
VADICKHDWHFVHGTSDLECRRCGEVSGPRTPEQLAKDLAVFGTSWSQDGKRIDPLDVYKVSEYDTTQFYMPTGQLQVANFKPNYNLTFHRDGKEVGKFDFNGPELIFEGDAAESAKVFIDCVANAFHGRLEQERKSELDKCCDLLEGMHAATDGNHNYYLHAANELRKLRNIK